MEKDGGGSAAQKLCRERGEHCCSQYCRVGGV